MVFLRKRSFRMHAWKKATFYLACVLSIESLVAAFEAAEPIVELSPYSVSGLAPSHRGRTVDPLVDLDRRDILHAGGADLAALLDGQPGVHSSQFAAGASRPVVRGLDGPRVLITDGGTELLDLSASSPDHAVVLLPDAARQVEVLRGPGALLYGTALAGAVVKVSGVRFAEYPEPDGLRSDLEYRYDGASDGGSAAVASVLHREKWAVRSQFQWRDHGDYRIPGAAASRHDAAAFHDDHALESEHEHEDAVHEEEDVSLPPPDGKLPNSFVRQESGGLGVSWFPRADSRVSFSWSGLRSRYGVPGHQHDHEAEHEHEEEPAHEEGEDPDHAHEGEEHEDEAHDHAEDSHGVAVNLHHQRWDLDGVLPLGDGELSAFKWQLQKAFYRHEELEGEVVGTRFRREGIAARAELLYRSAEDADGVLGVALANSEYRAKGAEALLPQANVANTALFALHSWKGEAYSASLGARAEYRELSKVGPTSDWAHALAADFEIPLGADWKTSVSLSRTERLPNEFELYADGAHIATRQYEVGDPTLGKEAAWSAEWGIEWQNRRGSLASLHIHGTRYEGFLYAAPSDAFVDGLRVYPFLAADASFYGFEWRSLWVFESTSSWNWVISTMADAVRAEDDAADGPLPRIPPLRLGAGLGCRGDGWRVELSWVHHAAQNRIAEHEFPSDAYELVEFGISREWQWNKALVELYVKAQNLLDEEVRPHVSYLKDLAPAPGRNGVIGLRFSY
jgi:iron complex outermembrane receptor protein